MTNPARPIVVTRVEPPGHGLSGELARLGLPMLHWPVVGIELADPGAWAAERGDIETFDWIVFTSAHAVEAVTESLPVKPHARIAAVGPSTADTLRERGWPVDIIGEGHGAEGLVSALARAGVRTQRVLYPASSRALATVSDGLSRLGAEVVRFVAYRTVAAALDTEACRSWIERHAIGAVTFASPSAVIELERALGRADLTRLLADAPALAIGPTTARELASRGIAPRIAESHTLRGLALACRALFGTPSPQAAQPAPEEGPHELPLR